MDQQQTTSMLADVSDATVGESASPPSVVRSVLDSLTLNVALEKEVQCMLCHGPLFRPVTVPCGHSYCRGCLLDSLLSKDLEESNCPFCRATILEPDLIKTPLTFPINITLWNVVQLISTRHSEEELQKESEDYAYKLDQLDARWRIHCLHQVASKYHGDDNERTEEDVPENEEVIPDSEEEPSGMVELHVEDREEGELNMRRNVVLDTEDVNFDGLRHMQLGFAIMDIPSMLQTQNRDQQIVMAILKMEEDEARETTPFILEGDGDDELVHQACYNDVSLDVTDEDGNRVMHRIRSAMNGVIEFPELYLDVPSGTYTFKFTDQTTGAYFMFNTEVRDAGSWNMDMQDDGIGSYIRSQAGYNGPRDVSQDDGEESDDSFVVADDVVEMTEDKSDDEGLWLEGDSEEERLETRWLKRKRKDENSAPARKRAKQIIIDSDEESGEEATEQAENEVEEISEVEVQDKTEAIPDESGGVKEEPEVVHVDRTT